MSHCMFQYLRTMESVLFKNILSRYTSNLRPVPANAYIPGHVKYTYNSLATGRLDVGVSIMLSHMQFYCLI